MVERSVTYESTTGSRVGPAEEERLQAASHQPVTWGHGRHGLRSGNPLRCCRHARIVGACSTNVWKKCRLATLTKPSCRISMRLTTSRAGSCGAATLRKMWFRRRASGPFDTLAPSGAGMRVPGCSKSCAPRLSRGYRRIARTCSMPSSTKRSIATAVKPSTRKRCCSNARTVGIAASAAQIAPTAIPDMTVIQRAFMRAGIMPEASSGRHLATCVRSLTEGRQPPVQHHSRIGTGSTPQLEEDGHE